MNKKPQEQSVTIDGVEYSLSDLSETAKLQILNIQFVDAQMQQLSNELAVADTAKQAYANALKNEVNASQAS